MSVLPTDRYEVFERALGASELEPSELWTSELETTELGTSELETSELETSELETSELDATADCNHGEGPNRHRLGEFVSLATSDEKLYVPVVNW